MNHHGEHFKVGDRVRWNSEAGRVRGKIIKVHTKDFDYKGYTHHGSKDEPQDEIKSDKSEHIAANKARRCIRSIEQCRLTLDEPSQSRCNQDAQTSYPAKDLNALVDRSLAKDIAPSHKFAALVRPRSGAR